MASLSKQEAIAELWRRGILHWKCHPIQKEMYDLFYKAPEHSVMVWLLARQSGKSYLLAILALEQAYRKPNSIIKLVTDTKLHIKSIFEIIFKQLLEDCPESLKPKYHKNFFTYEFPNGSQIQLAGTDGGHYEKLRGQRCDLVLVDEAGFCNDLETVIWSILFPTTTHTGGKIILASTPPDDMEHSFLQFIEQAQMNGTLTVKTIDDNPLLDQAQKDEIAKKMHGRDSERFRREYLCQLIKNTETAVLPEFTDELKKEITKDWPKPPHYDCYVAMDLGGKDLTAVLFGYYDFRAGKIIIEDELVLDFSKKDTGLPQLISGIQEKEAAIWTNIYTNEVKQPLVRVSDINYIVTQEIASLTHGKLYFTIPKKDDKDAAINNLRMLLSNKKIIINPKCKNLLRHLENVRYFSAKNKDKFARSPDNGHYDLVDALLYLTRSVSFNKNPYPWNYNMNEKDLYIHNKAITQGGNSSIGVFKKIFNKK